jgi:hypothetical protein
MATITVLADISAAANAGDSRIPCGATTPAASGMAKTLYPDRRALWTRRCCLAVVPVQILMVVVAVHVRAGCHRVLRCFR